jgi:surface antigen
MDYSALASKLNSDADSLEATLNTIDSKKGSFNKIWSGPSHDNLMSNYGTSVNNAIAQVGNMRKLAGCLNNLQAYKDKKETRDSLQTQLNNTPVTDENSVAISRLKYDIGNLNSEIDSLRKRISGAASSFSKVSKKFSIITFDTSEEKASTETSDSSSTENSSPVSTSGSTQMVKTSYSNPDFNNSAAWVSQNPYAQAGYTGQCTWFSWGKFYETYGYSPGFTGNGCDCADQLLAAHGDKFYRSDTPVSGSVFSVLASGGHPYGHTGMIIAVDGDTITVQDGNYNGTSDSFAVAQNDWRTYTTTLSEFKSRFGNVVFANPI